jgi:hypothetical protein
MTPPAPDAPAVSPAQKWAITLTVMVVAFMLDASATASTADSESLMRAGGAA